VSDQQEVEWLGERGEELSAAVLDLAARVDELSSMVEARDGAFEHALRAARPALEATPRPAGPLAEVHRALEDLAEAVEGLVHSAVPARRSRDALAASGRLQRRLVQPGDAEVPGATVRSWSRRRSDCGSDWWSVRPSVDGGGIVVLGEVDGHGAGTALVSAMLYGALGLALMGMGDQLRPHHLLRALNQALAGSTARSGPGSRPLRSSAIAVAVAEGGTELRVANAGHDAPAFRAFGQWGVLRSDPAPPLGERATARYPELVLPVKAGDRVVLFTDGVSGVRDAHGRKLGSDAVYAACAEAPPDGTAADLCEALGDLVTRHAGSQPLVDDATVLVLEIAEPSPRAG